MLTDLKSEYYCNGVLKNKGEYISGTSIRTGKWKTYFSNGNIESEGSYENDKKTGAWIYYHESGKFKYIKVFKNGIVVEKQQPGVEGE